MLILRCANVEHEKLGYIKLFDLKNFEFRKGLEIKAKDFYLEDEMLIVINAGNILIYKIDKKTYELSLKEEVKGIFEKDSLEYIMIIDKKVDTLYATNCGDEIYAIDLKKKVFMHTFSIPQNIYSNEFMYTKSNYKYFFSHRLHFNTLFLQDK
jgi:hypothetical protein